MLTIEGLVAGSGDIVTLHKTLGNVLRAFKHGTGLRGSDDGNALGAGIGLQFIIDTLYQGILRTYHHHVDGFLHTEGFDGLEVIRLHGDVLTTVARTGVAWCDIKFLTLLTLSYFPCEGMLTTSAS